MLPLFVLVTFCCCCLSCNFSCEVVGFLLQTFAQFKTNELLQSKCFADFFLSLSQIVFYFLIWVFHESLFQQAAFSQEFIDLTADNFVEHFRFFTLLQSFGTQNFFFFRNESRRNLIRDRK